jgi:hypothetical protein
LLGGDGVGGVVVAGEMIFLSISPYGESAVTSMAVATIAIPNPSKILIL